nr:hypothetical protein [Streptomyces mesophilus]
MMPSTEAVLATEVGTDDRRALVTVPDLAPGAYSGPITVTAA